MARPSFRFILPLSLVNGPKENQMKKLIARFEDFPQVDASTIERVVTDQPQRPRPLTISVEARGSAGHFIQASETVARERGLAEAPSVTGESEARPAAMLILPASG